MEFTFKKVVKSELVGCRLCKDIYFRPNRIDLIESHLKTEHKINFDNQSDSEVSEPVKQEPQQNGLNGSHISVTSPPSITSSPKRIRKPSLKRRLSSLSRLKGSCCSESENEIIPDVSPKSKRPVGRPRKNKEKPGTSPKVKRPVGRPRNPLKSPSKSEMPKHEKVVVIPPMDFEQEDTSFSEASCSDSEIDDPNLSARDLKSLFNKKYYKQAQNDERLRVTEKDGKKIWDCKDCNVTETYRTPLLILDHYVVHHENRKFKCPHDGCDTETSSARKLVDHLKSTKRHQNENFLQLPDGGRIKKDERGFINVIKEIRKTMGIIK